ncbi:MAG TPA: hypothetical protein VK099_09190 [Alcanivoracaceae bacterium]|nr:hypothetical protein [Alcanivoracaceae bacterium]
MIGNAYAWGQTGFSIVEEGELDAATLSLRIEHYRVVNRKGEMLEDTFATIEAAREFIDKTEKEA